MRVLLIDDEQFYYKLIRKSLSESEYEIEYAQSGNEGLSKISSFNPEMLIVDLKLPGMDGFQVLERLRRDAKFSHIPVIVITAQDELGDKLKAFKLGADDYPVKPLCLFRDPRGLPVLFEALRSEDPLNRTIGIQRLREITGKEFGYNPQDPPGDREDAVRRWEAWLEEAGPQGPAMQMLLRTVYLCNNAVFEAGSYRGDPTEAAIFQAAREKVGELAAERLGEIPFDADRKRMTTINRWGGELFVFTKGALEMVLTLCDLIMVGERVEALTDDRKEALLKAYHTLMDEGSGRDRGWSGHRAS